VTTQRSRDDLVPDPAVGKELGIGRMAMWRWTHDPNLGFPAPIKIRGRNFRSRRALEEFKRRMIRAGGDAA
jgi:hypothetical protein